MNSSSNFHHFHPTHARRPCSDRHPNLRSPGEQSLARCRVCLGDLSHLAGEQRAGRHRFSSSSAPFSAPKEWIFGPIFLIELLIKLAPALEFGSWAGHALIFAEGVGSRSHQSAHPFFGGILAKSIQIFFLDCHALE